MRVLVSRGLSAVAYGADVLHNDLGKTVVIHPGRNQVTAEDADFLRQSPSFQKHTRNGTFAFTKDDAPEPDTEDSRARRHAFGTTDDERARKVGSDGKEPATTTATAPGASTAGPTGSGDGGAGSSGGVAEDPRARKPKESDKSYAARMAKLDEETAKAGEKAERDRVFLETFNAMTDEEKAAMFPTLTDEEKALIDGQGTKT